MPGTKPGKVEAWLTEAELAHVRGHMRAARIKSVAAYTRACVLAGFPREALAADRRIGELAMAVNHLTRVIGTDKEAVGALLPQIRKLTRTLQTDYAEQSRRHGDVP